MFLYAQLPRSRRAPGSGESVGRWFPAVFCPHSAAGRVAGPVAIPVRLTGEGMESRIERLCVERGLKMTGQRRVIARVLSECDDHPDVEELYRRCSETDPRISIATVYRTVRLFEERGILARRDFGGGRARYEAAAHGHHHHLIDIETGRVIEFADSEHERVLQTIAARLGFDLVSHRLELYGRRRPDAAPPAPAKAAAPKPVPAKPPRKPTPGSGRKAGQ